MAMPPLVILSEASVQQYFPNRSHVGEMARAVQVRIDITSSSSLRKFAPVISQSFNMPLDRKAEANRGSALRRDAIPPIEQSKSSLVAAGTQNVPSASVNKEVKPFSVGSLDLSVVHNKAKSWPGSLAFRKSQGRALAPKNKKCSANNSSGRWTAAEHEAFLQGLKVYGREWKKVSTCIPTRTSAQIRSHAQKYFTKVTKEQQNWLVMAEKRQAFESIEPSLQNNDQPISQSYTGTMNSIIKYPSETETRVCKTLASLRERYKQLEGRLQQIQAPTSADPPAISREAVLGPASAALELEQISLRKAAKARYEIKKLESRQHKKQPATITTESCRPVCARVSLATMPSQGGFDSSDVIALSMLGDNLGREKVESKKKKDQDSSMLVRERLQLIERDRPSKMRKIDEH